MSMSMRKSMRSKGRKSFHTYSPDRNKSNEKRQVLITYKPPPRSQPFNPKQFIVAQCSERDIEIFKQIFDFFDMDQDGMLTPMDLRRAMLQFGGYNPQKKFIYQMISQYDQNESGDIEFKQFVKMMTLKPCQNDTTQDIRRVFNQIDSDQKGYITKQDLKLFAEDLKQELKEQQIDQIIRKCDPNSKNVISWQAFLAFNKRKTF